MKPEATETPIPSLNTSYPAGPFSGAPSPARAFYTSYPAGPFSGAPSPARALTCPVLSVSVRKCTTLSVQWGPPVWLRRESFEGALNDG